MDAIERTATIRRMEVPMANLVKQEHNPNIMSGREFDLLVDNFGKVGWVDPLFVRPIDGEGPDGGPRFRIVGGAHRYDAGEYLGFTMAPVTIVSEDFEEDEERFQVVRMNVIHGKLDPAAFFAMYEQLNSRYSQEVLQDAFGFADDAAFKNLIDQSARTLPSPALRQKFKEAAQEIKTIDGLATLLNQMFSKYGQTLPYGYMIVDYGGQRSVWIQVSKKTMDALDLIGTTCIERERIMDDVLGSLIQQIAVGKLAEPMEKAIAASDPVVLPPLATLPTRDNVAAVQSIATAGD